MPVLPVTATSWTSGVSSWLMASEEGNRAVVSATHSASTISRAKGTGHHRGQDRRSRGTTTRGRA